MLLSYETLLAIRNQPDILQEFVVLHNTIEEISNEILDIYQDFFANSGITDTSLTSDIEKLEEELDIAVRKLHSFTQKHTTP